MVKLDEHERLAIAADLRAGKSQHQAAKDWNRSKGTVNTIARAYNIQPRTLQTAKATDARRYNAEIARLARIEKELPRIRDAAQLLEFVYRTLK